jgi:hypothetical protein
VPLAAKDLPTAQDPRCPEKGRRARRTVGVLTHDADYDYERARRLIEQHQPPPGTASLPAA